MCYDSPWPSGLKRFSSASTVPFRQCRLCRFRMPNVGRMPPVNWASTIYHGMPLGLYPFDPKGGDYLAFLGRISPEKRPDRAIEIAKRSGVPLRIAAKVDPADREYFKCEIEPLLDHPLVEFIGEIDDRQKNEFLGGALALLFPIDWPEPFGLVMIESMSSGTPVIAWNNGSVPEIIDDAKSGVIVDIHGGCSRCSPKGSQHGPSASPTNV